MNTKTRQRFLSAFFSIAVLILPFSAGAAIGLSPPSVYAPSVFRGIEQEFSMRLSRSGSVAEPLTINIEKRGDFANYIEGPSEIVMAAGEDSAIYEFKIVPTEAANGDYEVIISFLVGVSDPTVATEGSSVKIVTGVSGVVRFSVSGEEVVAYKVSNLSSSDTEIGQPLFMSLSIQNKGNVEWRPEKIQLTFLDANDATNIVSETILGEKISTVKPGGETSSVVLESMSKLIEGTYTVAADVYYKGEVVESLESFKFTVYPSGTLAQRGELSIVTTNKTVYELGEKIKLDAVFENTGEIQVKGVLMTEIFKGDDYVDLVRAEEIYVDKGEKSNMSLIIDLDESGEYKLSSSVKYGNKQTESIDTLISVGVGVATGATAGQTLGFLNSWFGIGILILILVGVVVAIKIIKKKKTPKSSITATSMSVSNEMIEQSEKSAESQTDDSNEPRA